MNQKSFTPLESLAPWGGDEYNPVTFSERAGFKALPFLTGFTPLESPGALGWLGCNIHSFFQERAVR
jgi:hypothetical protein